MHCLLVTRKYIFLHFGHCGSILVCLLPYTSLPLDGVARNFSFFFLFYLHGYIDHLVYHAWIHLFFQTSMPKKRKTIWSELDLNPGPLAPQATTLTTRPWLLRQGSMLVKNFPLSYHFSHC